MTISVPVSLELVSTNVTDIVEAFNNTKPQNFSEDQQLRDGTWIYQNIGGNVVVPTYDSGGTYEVGDIVYRSSYIQKVTDTEGTVAKQPEEYYTLVDTSFDNSNWDYRYMKLLDIPTGGSVFGVNTLILHQVPCDVTFSADGSNMYIANSYNGMVLQYTLATSWDITTATMYQSVYTAYDTINCVTFSPDGVHMYVVVAGSVDKILEYYLATPWDITSSIYNNIKDTIGDIPYSVAFNSTGTKMYELDANTYSIYQYTLSTAWDLSTATYDSVSINVQSSGSRDIVFSSDGTKLYEADGTNDKIHMYTLSTPWDISTAIYTSINIDTQDYVIGGVAFNNDGTRMYEMGIGTKKVYEYVLSTPWDISTAFYAAIPFSYSEVRSGNTYEYLVDYDGSNFTFTSKVNGSASSYSPMLQYYSVIQTTDEPKAYIGPNGTWIAKTLVIREGEGLYIRTDKDVAIETKVITEYQTEIVTNLSQIGYFAQLERSNTHKPFDDKNYTTATSSSPMTYIVKGTQKFDTVALGRVRADTAVIVFKDPLGVVVDTINATIDGSVDTAGIIEDTYTTVIYYSSEVMDINSTVEITLSSTSGSVELGTIKLGQSVDAGMTELSLRHKYRDFSIAEYDTWGNLDYVERQRINSFNGSVKMVITDYDRIIRLFTLLGKSLVIVNGSTVKTNAVPDSTNIFASTQKIGRFMNFEQKTAVSNNNLDELATYTFTLEELA